MRRLNGEKRLNYDVFKDHGSSFNKDIICYLTAHIAYLDINIEWTAS